MQQFSSYSEIFTTTVRRTGGSPFVLLITASVTIVFHWSNWLIITITILIFFSEFCPDNANRITIWTATRCGYSAQQLQCLIKANSTRVRSSSWPETILPITVGSLIFPSYQWISLYISDQNVSLADLAREQSPLRVLQCENRLVAGIQSIWRGSQCSNCEIQTGQAERIDRYR